MWEGYAGLTSTAIGKLVIKRLCSFLLFLRYLLNAPSAPSEGKKGTSLRSPAGECSLRTACRLSSTADCAGKAGPSCLVPTGVAEPSLAFPFHQAMPSIVKLHLFCKVRSIHPLCCFLEEKVRVRSCLVAQPQAPAFTLTFADGSPTIHPFALQRQK